MDTYNGVPHSFSFGHWDIQCHAGPCRNSLHRVIDRNNIAVPVCFIFMEYEFPKTYRASISRNDINAEKWCVLSQQVKSTSWIAHYCIPLPWASVHWLVKCTLECHWNATGWPSVHWDTTGRRREYLQGALVHQWKNLVETAPHCNATGVTLTAYTHPGTYSWAE